MNDLGRRCRRVAALVTSCVLTGCATHAGHLQAVDPGGCPEALRQAVTVSASAVQIDLPQGLRVPAAAVPLIAGTGRRVMFAVRISRQLPRVRLLSDALDMLTYGGTLAGWARIVRPPAAVGAESVQVQGGWLEIEPFIPGSRLHPRTQTVDLLVIPGGGPTAALALRPGRLWGKDGQAVPGRSLTPTLVPEIHMTRLHAVDATATFRFTVRHLTGAREHWQCTIATNFTLLDRDQALPDLWVLRYRGAHGGTPGTVGLYRADLGAFQAVFLNPQAARAFARWMSAVHARRAGPYPLGFLETHGQAIAPIAPGAFGHLRITQWGSR